jgi:iron complex transport system ATP-binding protein
VSLDIHALNFSYSDKPVLHDIHLQNMPKGELTVVLGPNAAGKSTLFRCLSGLLSPDSGRIVLGGRNLHALHRDERFRAVCYMPQVFASQARLSVFEVILLARKSLASWRVSGKDMAVVDELLRNFGIEHLASRLIGELSGGQQQLVSLCQALAREPELFLLDEPTSALDLGRQLSVLHRLKQETVARQTVTLIALHDLSLAVRFADQVLVMSAGRIRAFGPTEGSEQLPFGLLSQPHHAPLIFRHDTDAARIIWQGLALAVYVALLY